MSFIGLVTRKEEDTGVSLMAKVVTPNKKKSAKKTFKVKVKKNALDDFSCCVIDHATVKNQIENSQDLDAVISDFNFVYNGVHGTTITYTLQDTTTPGISSYISEDGKLNYRPQYGDNTVSGYIEIAVTKGEARVSSRIIITLQPLTPEEILGNEEVINPNILWTLIKGENKAQDTITSDLKLAQVKSYSVQGAKEPIQITYTVQDGTSGYPDLPYTGPRINADTGAVQRPTYTEACAMYKTFAGNDNVVVSLGSTSNVTAQGKFVRIGNLKLLATLKLGEAQRIFTYSLSTISKYLTNQEVMNAIIIPTMTVTNTSTGAVYRYVDDADSSSETLASVPGAVASLKAFGGVISETLISEDLEIRKGELINVEFDNDVTDWSGNDYSFANIMANGLGGGFQSVTESGSDLRYYDKLDITYDAFSSAAEAAKQFAIKTVITVSGYSANGNTPTSSTPVTATRRIRFKIV